MPKGLSQLPASITIDKDRGLNAACTKLWQKSLATGHEWSCALSYWFSSKIEAQKLREGNRVSCNIEQLSIRNGANGNMHSHPLRIGGFDGEYHQAHSVEDLIATNWVERLGSDQVFLQHVVTGSHLYLWLSHAGSDFTGMRAAAIKHRDAYSNTARSILNQSVSPVTPESSDEYMEAYAGLLQQAMLNDPRYGYVMMESSRISCFELARAYNFGFYHADWTADADIVFRPVLASDLSTDMPTNAVGGAQQAINALYTIPLKAATSKYNWDWRYRVMKKAVYYGVGMVATGYGLYALYHKYNR